MIPLVDLKAQYRSIRDDIDGAVTRVLARADFIQGEEVSLFEQEFAAYCGTSQAIGVSSGTQALHLALSACGIGPGDEVITSPFTFSATAEAVYYLGGRPVFIDVDPVTCNLSPELIEKAITERTRAIVPVHLYGRPAAMVPIMDIARRRGLKVVEDAAQAHGAVYKGRTAGAIGDAGCFSFYPAKNLGAYGDAGMVVTSDPEIGERVRLLRDHGRTDKYEHTAVGYNARLDTLQAAVLRVKLRCLDHWTWQRRRIAEQYRELLANQPVQVLQDEEDTLSVYHLMVVRTPFREHVRNHLLRQGISTGIHFPIPLHLQPAYRELEYREGSLPESERAAREVLSLPIYPELSDAQVFQVASAVKEALLTAEDSGPGPN